MLIQECVGIRDGLLEEAKQTLCRRSRCKSSALCIMKQKALVAGKWFMEENVQVFLKQQNRNKKFHPCPFV